MFRKHAAWSSDITNNIRFSIDKPFLRNRRVGFQQKTTPVASLEHLKEDFGIPTHIKLTKTNMWYCLIYPVGIKQIIIYLFHCPCYWSLLGVPHSRNSHSPPCATPCVHVSPTSPVVWLPSTPHHSPAKHIIGEYIHIFHVRLHTPLVSPSLIK